jgi:hypothetical protein
MWAMAQVQLVLACAAAIAAHGRARADPEPRRFAVAAGIGMGTGTGRFGAFGAVAKLDGYAWLGRGIGIAATAVGHRSEGCCFDDLDTSPTATGSLLAAGIAYRIEGSTPVGVFERADAVFSLVVGRDHHDGHAAEFGRQPFDDTNVGWMARVAGHYHRGRFMLVTELVVHGAIGHGAGVLLTLGAGASL